MVATGDPIEMSDLRGSGAFEQLMKVEQAAIQIYLNQPLFVPGLLQVHGYAEEMISRTAGLRPDDQELADRVSIRLQRGATLEKRLQGATPPHLWAVIDEGALRRIVGGRDAMREQLDHLAAMSALSTVHLGIIPLGYGAHAGLKGSFEIHELAGGEASVYFEGGQGDEIVGTDRELARQFRETFDGLMEAAVSGPEARTLLAAISGEL